MNKDIIMREDPAAATPVTLSGWRSRDGYFYTDESTARYAGCTHVKCKDCGAPAEKSWTVCRPCRDLREDVRYDAMPKAEWDGVAMVFSQTRDEYYNSPEDAADALEEGETLESLRLVICKPYRGTPLTEDYFSDDMPDEDNSDLPAALIEAIDAFNKAIAGIKPLSWSPGKFALALPVAAHVQPDDAAG
jgi:hypothetical protein